MLMHDMSNKKGSVATRRLIAISDNFSLIKHLMMVE